MDDAKKWLGHWNTVLKVNQVGRDETRLMGVPKREPNSNLGNEEKLSSRESGAIYLGGCVFICKCKDSEAQEKKVVCLRN